MKQPRRFEKIAKHFWPREMKELVAKYEAEGTLNEEVVRNFDRGGIVLIFVCLLPFLLILCLSNIDFSWFLACSIYSFYSFFG